MNQTHTLTDWRGKELVPGTVIVYPTGASSNIYMVEAIVAKVEYVPETKRTITRDPVTGTQSSRVATVYTPVLYVRRMKERAYSTTSKTDSTRLQKITRVGRVTVVQRADPNNCNFEGCTEDLDHDDPGSSNYYPAHSFER